MRSKSYNNISNLAESLGLSKERGLIAEMKAKLTKEIIKTMAQKGLTHQEVSELSGVPRSSITGIVNRGLQKVSIERLMRILGALGKTVELKVKRAA